MSRRIMIMLTAVILVLGYKVPVLAVDIPDADTVSVKMMETVASYPHPRLLISDREFNSYRKEVKKGRNAALSNLHSAQMALADRYAAQDDHLTYYKDLSGMRILHVSGRALAEIFACAYAYRFTGERRYLERVERVMRDVCGFPDWNPSHFLDTAEMSAAVALGYDWLYSSLNPEVREMARKALLENVVDGSKKRFYINKTNNWNQVCNGCVVCASLALCDLYPEFARDRILECIRTNSKVMDTMYAPDGVYPEGPSYWEYGTMFEILMLRALENCFGTDFGISGKPGFLKTGRFEMFAASGTGKFFNYYDSIDTVAPSPALWYFATSTGDASVVSNELARASRPETSSAGNRLMPLFLIYVSKYRGPSSVACPDGFFAGRGKTPVVMARFGTERDNVYLGVKGGAGTDSHGHLDAGTFVYDAYGYRWACDLNRPEYTVSEAGLAKFGTGLWNTKPTSWRWYLTAYNNYHHNTITVNNKLLVPDGRAEVTGVVDEPSRKGAVVDLSAAVSPDLDRAVRRAEILDDGTLEVTDSLTAGGVAPAFVRWTMVSPASAEVGDEGILLTQGDVTVCLSTSGAEVRYTTWPGTPDPSMNPLADFDKGTSNVVCGYTAVVPRGGSIVLKTTVRRIR